MSPKTVIVEDGRVRFMHIRIFDKGSANRQNRQGISNHGGITLAYQRSTDLKTFRYAFCICRLNENFSRKLGRLIASNYLEAGHGYEIDTPAPFPVSYYLESVAKPTAITKFLAKNPTFNKELF